MNIFGRIKISTLKKGDDWAVIALTGGKGALKSELISYEENEEDMTYPMVMTLKGTPLVEMHPSYCPTFSGLLATGYGLEAAKCAELRAISDKLNEGYAGFEEALETLRPLIGLLEDGLYLIRDTQTYPTDGNGRFFWAVPDELTYYDAYTDSYYINELWESIEPDSRYLYPTQSRDRYNESRVEYYAEKFRAGGERPRAVAYNEMSGMSALLDGHHKACAAAKLHSALDTIVITKGRLYGSRDDIRIRFGNGSNAGYDVKVDTGSGLPEKLYKKYTEMMENNYAKKRTRPALYKGVPIESRFTGRNWESCYTEISGYYMTMDEYAADKACYDEAKDTMSAHELYEYINRQEKAAFYARGIIKRMLLTGDSRTRELLMELVRMPVSGDTKPIIAAAMEGLLNFRGEETEKVFVDFVVSGDSYLSDKAKEYW